MSLYGQQVEVKKEFKEETRVVMTARKREVALPQREARKSPVATAPLSFVTWGTMQPPDRWSDGQPRVCLWGSREDALHGCDPYESVVRVRVEVLSVRRVARLI